MSDFTRNQSAPPGRTFSGRDINLRLSTLTVYEVAAVLFSVLARPQDLSYENKMAGYQAALCRLYIEDRAADPEWAVSGSVKPAYALPHPDVVNRQANELERGLKKAMVAGHMAMAFLPEDCGVAVRLPPRMPRSLSALAALAGNDAGINDPQNLQRLIWRPYGPVLHIATAITVVVHHLEPANKAAGQADAAAAPDVDFFTAPELIRMVATLSELHAGLMLKVPQLKAHSDTRVRLRLA
jgi:hypothetical protein